MSYNGTIYEIEAIVENGASDFQILDSGGVAFSTDANGSIIIEIPQTTAGVASSYVDITLENNTSDDMFNLTVFPIYNDNDSESTPAHEYLEFSTDATTWKTEQEVTVANTLTSGSSVTFYVRQNPPASAPGGTKYVSFDLEYEIDD